MRPRTLVLTILLAVALQGCASRGPVVVGDSRAPQALAARQPSHEIRRAAAPQALATASRPSRARRIARGAAIGFAAGAALGLAPWSREACLNAPRWHCAAKGGVTGAAVGAAIGAAKK